MAVPGESRKYPWITFACVFAGLKNFHRYRHQSFAKLYYLSRCQRADLFIFYIYSRIRFFWLHNDACRPGYMPRLLRWLCLSCFYRAHWSSGATERATKIPHTKSRWTTGEGGEEHSLSRDCGRKRPALGWNVLPSSPTSGLSWWVKNEKSWNGNNANNTISTHFHFLCTFIHDRRPSIFPSVSGLFQVLPCYAWISLPCVYIMH